jgi:hypothetical protein
MRRHAAFTCSAGRDAVLHMTTLAIHDKLLANRGNGDSVDYRLTLPPT